MAWVRFIWVAGVATLFAPVFLLIATPNLALSLSLGFLPLVGVFLLALGRLIEDGHTGKPLLLWGVAFAALLVTWWFRYPWLGYVVALGYAATLYRLYPLRFGRKPNQANQDRG